jgi:hypothetical protein
MAEYTVTLHPGASGIDTGTIHRAPLEAEIGRLRAALSASEARAKELERERDEQIAAREGMQAAFNSTLATAEARREEAERRAAVAEALNPAAVSVPALAEITATLTRERDEARRALREVARRGSLPIKVDGVWPKGAAEHTCRVIGEAVDWITEPARALSGAGAEDGR